MKSLYTPMALIVCLAAILTPNGHAQEPNWLHSLQSIGQDTDFTLEKNVSLSFDTHHPQGMTIIGDKLYLSSVKTINKREGKGHGYLFELDMNGKLLRSLELGDGPAYHPSGIDFDGKYIWVAVAEYRPDSSTVIYRVDPDSFDAQEMFRFNDHIGGIVSVPSRKELIGVSWGSRRIYRWALNKKGHVQNPDSPEKVMNPNHFIDYQDGQWVRGTDFLIMGGVSGYRGSNKAVGKVSVGGLALVDIRNWAIQWTAPISLYSKKGRVMNQNPFYLHGEADGTLKLYFIPDDNSSIMYIYSIDK